MLELLELRMIGDIGIAELQSFRFQSPISSFLELFNLRVFTVFVEVSQLF